MSTYSEILLNLKNGICNYGNVLSGVSYSLGVTKMKIDAKGNLIFFSSLEQMARNINKFIKTGL